MLFGEQYASATPVMSPLREYAQRYRSACSHGSEDWNSASTARWGTHVVLPCARPQAARSTRTLPITASGVNCSREPTVSTRQARLLLLLPTASFGRMMIKLRTTTNTVSS